MADDLDARICRGGSWWFNPGPSSSGGGGGFVDAPGSVSCSTAIADAPRGSALPSDHVGSSFADSFSLSAHFMDWGHDQLRSSGKAENSFHAMLQEDMSTRPYNFRQGSIEPELEPSMSQNFLLDHHQHHPSSTNDPAPDCSVITSYALAPTAYGCPPVMHLQTLLEADAKPQQSVYYDQPTETPMATAFHGTNWPVLKDQEGSSNPLHFSNNTPFWNASATAVNEAKSGFYPNSVPSQFVMPAFEPKLPSCSNFMVKSNRDASMPKKSGSETALKKPRVEAPSPLPTFKVRKEKLGDRITALQQLVSPFGKTDTASVLHEAIEYIKFLHNQVGLLSTPYLKNGQPMQQQQSAEKSKEGDESKKDLRSRGLCLVPVPSTYPMASEATVEFWHPTFGGTFR
uniref:BHLH domain-containing protein n=1 Tax=Ananas comosus var. bracteatus TaxID=296719 RepID=A0A6V7QE49_ANACO|nr:unnamed protein product [Ananas comosus var. bracteatus]